MPDSTFVGSVEHSGLPVARGLSLDLAFFHVANVDTPPPFDGDPPGDAVTDCHTIYNQVDLDSESIDIADLIPFSLPCESGVYYVQLRATLYRFANGKHFAQAEQFFFTRRPLELTPDHPAVTLPMQWPDIPLEDLGVYGTVKPKRTWPGRLTWFLRTAAASSLECRLVCHVLHFGGVFWFATPRTPPLWHRGFPLVNCFVLRRLLASEGSGVVKTFRCPHEIID